MYSVCAERFRMYANSGVLPEEAQGPIACSFTSRYELPSSPRANVPFVVFEIELPFARVSFREMVKVAWNGFPVTVLPPKPPIRPPNSNMPSPGPPNRRPCPKPHG